MDRSLHSIQDICEQITHFPATEVGMKSLRIDEAASDDDDDISLLDSNEDETAHGSLLDRLKSWVYPPNTNPEVQLWRLDNIAIPFSYLLVGTFQGLSSGVMTIYLLRLNATEAQQTTILNLRALPAALKVLFGFISDTTPLFGYRRKSYMVIGWIVSSISMACMSSISDPSIDIISLLYFLFGLGFWFADVIADTLMTEKTRHEPEEMRGTLQSLCYSCRFFALMISSIMATYAMEESNAAAVFQVMAILPWLFMMPSIWFLKEIKDTPVTTISHQCNEIWTTICSRAVWQPMASIYFFNVFQVGNAAWTQYMYNYWFAFGDSAMADLVAGIQFLPNTIMMAHLCPVGSEGASFAMFTTINNSAMFLSSAISTLMLNIWDVSKDALERNDRDGMVNLTIVTTVIQTLGIVFVHLLPHRVEDMKKLNLTSPSSKLGGGIFLAVIILSIVYSVISGILNIVDPGWTD
eukprot:gene3350-6631_t